MKFVILHPKKIQKWFLDVYTTNNDAIFNMQKY